MNIKIIASSSTKWERFIKRWGVSFLVDDDILFDTFGKPSVFLKNIRKMNINIKNIKHVVISHDDWDHISGLWDLVKRNKDVNLYILKHFGDNIKKKIISFGVKLIEVDSLFKIKESIYTTGELAGESCGRFIYEQSLIVKSSNGISIITGCAHPGIINIIDTVKRNFPENIYLVLGGFHLKDSSEEQIAEIVDRLASYGNYKIAPMHCTGKEATRMIKEEFRDNFIQLSPTDAIEV